MPFRTEGTFCVRSNEHTGSEDVIQGGDEILNSSTSYVIYTVTDGVSLDDIAAHYGVDKDAILAFNGISQITTGSDLKIPGTTVDDPLAIADDSKEADEEETEKETDELPTGDE